VCATAGVWENKYGRGGGGVSVCLEKIKQEFSLLRNRGLAHTADILVKRKTKQKKN